MSRKWYLRDYQPMLDGGSGEVVEVSVSTDIAVTPAELWRLIKPAENAALFEPHVLKGFHIPGTPEGVGEMQGFIIIQEGRQQVVALEVVEEVSGEYVVSRLIGEKDDAAQTSFHLTGIRMGTRLEQKWQFTVPFFKASNAEASPEAHRNALRMLGARIKLVAESGWRQVDEIVQPSGNGLSGSCSASSPRDGRNLEE
ncbi:hypothetical protein [Georgenia yuyongxinii]|uniref:Polyketide cyclase/dehydrase/lipid transport protein n=1 Tax=Georgenia yuyongxinii TaxID=2589797 RepID=A0A552WK84_9MICO|nr:hypothetical protein [Georgenia yuyongxinii]TRW43152.1 hypothetical protein FJ693_18810 [Georgenia yuyongxinii]